MTHLWSSSAQANPSHACFAARPTAALQTCVCSGGTTRSGIARRGRSVAWGGIGRGACRGREEISGGAVSFKKKKEKLKIRNEESSISKEGRSEWKRNSRK